MGRLEFIHCQLLYWWLLEQTMSEIVILHSGNENILHFIWICSVRVWNRALINDTNDQ